MRGIAVLALVLLAAGCSGRAAPSSSAGSAASAAATARPGPTASAPPPAATGGRIVLYQDHTPQSTGFQPPAPTGTVVVVDPAGREIGRQDVSLAHLTFIGPAANLMSLRQLYLAGGAVYWADDQGTIRRWQPGASVSEIARIPFGDPRQQLAIAVSPDGKHVLASVYERPPFANPNPQSLDQAGFQSGVPFTMTTYAADAGGQATQVASVSYPTFPSPTVVAGWDAQGPLATLSSHLGTQQGTPGKRYFGRQLVHLAADGSHLAPVGGADCVPLDSVPDTSTILCGDYNQDYTIRSAAGDVVWKVAHDPATFFAMATLSPDGKRFAVQPATVFAEDGTKTALAPGFSPEGWLDPTTLVGSSASSEALLKIGGAQTLAPLNVGGRFLGTL